MISNKLHTQEYVIDVSGGDAGTGAVQLDSKAGAAPMPAGAILKNAYVKVLTAFVGGTNLAFGNTSDQDGYIAPVATAALLVNSVHSADSAGGDLLWDDTNDHKIYHVPADSDVFALMTGTHTAGKAVLVLEYYLPKEVA